MDLCPAQPDQPGPGERPYPVRTEGPRDLGHSLCSVALPVDVESIVMASGYSQESENTDFL